MIDVGGPNSLWVVHTHRWSWTAWESGLREQTMGSKPRGASQVAVPSMTSASTPVPGSGPDFPLTGLRPAITHVAETKLFSLQLCCFLTTIGTLTETSLTLFSPFLQWYDAHIQNKCMNVNHGQINKGNICTTWLLMVLLCWPDTKKCFKPLCGYLITCKNPLRRKEKFSFYQ